MVDRDDATDTPSDDGGPPFLLDNFCVVDVLDVLLDFVLDVLLDFDDTEADHEETEEELEVVDDS